MSKEIFVEKNKDISKLNTFGIKSKAEFFTEIRKEKELRELIFLLNEKYRNFFILGGGSNTIFPDFYKGLVVKFSSNKIVKIKDFYRVKAGKELDKALAHFQKEKKYKIQALAGVPGTIAGAISQNAGCFGQEIKNFVKAVHVYDFTERSFKSLSNKDCCFEYRSSVFKKHPKRYLILEVDFDFSKSFYDSVCTEEQYFSLKDFKKQYALEDFKMSELRNKIKALRRKHYPNLKTKPSAGSVFKNAEISKTLFVKIQKKYPDIPSWQMPKGKIKIPTAYILDKVLNLKGKSFGKIRVDENKPLFLINTGGATAKDLKRVIEKIKRLCEEKTGIVLEEEVVFL